MSEVMEKVVTDREVQKETLEKRLAGKKELIDLKVTVTAVQQQALEPLVGKVVTLVSVDDSDSYATFRVNVPEDVFMAVPNSCRQQIGSGPSYSIWVHDVVWFDPSADGVKVEQPVDTPVTMTKAEHDALVARVQTVQSQLRVANRQLESFKENVIEAAVQAVRDGNWCEAGVTEALEELGLEWPDQSKEIEFDVQITVHVTATVGGDNAGQADDESFVQGCLSVGDDGEVGYDSDLDDVSMSVSDWSISGLCEV